MGSLQPPEALAKMSPFHIAAALLVLAAVADAKAAPRPRPMPAQAQHLKKIVENAHILEKKKGDDKKEEDKKDEDAGASPSPSPMGYMPPAHTNAKMYQAELGKAPIIELTKDIFAGERIGIDCLLEELPIAAKFCDEVNEPKVEGDKAIRLVKTSEESKIYMPTVWAKAKKGDKLDVCALYAPAEKKDDKASLERDSDMERRQVFMGDEKTGWDDCEGCGEEISVYCCPKDKKTFGLTLHQAGCEGAGSL